MLSDRFESARFIAGLLLTCFSSAAVGQHWPQASGPNANWKIDGQAPTTWSVVRHENVAWRTKLPEGGQSSVTVWGDRLFLTCHAPLASADEATSSTDIDGYCLRADTGEILWKVRLPGSVAVGTAGVFSDATVFAPIADGEHVWFFNRSGSMGCYDFNGKRKWIREFTPRNRHTNRQCEPVIFNNQLITVEALDKAAAATLKRHAPVPDDIDPKSVWTYLHGIDKHTGKVLWTESVGTVCHNTPIIGYMSDGMPAIAHCRGGAHGPLETPNGISLTSLAAGREGQTLWSTELLRFDPSFNSHWDQRFVYGFHVHDHVTLDTNTGAEVSRVSLHDNVTLWKRDTTSDDWKAIRNTTVKAGRRHANTNQTNIVVGDWHYFLAHDTNAIGRVNGTTRQVEYLEVPVQIAAQPAGRDQWIWNAKQAIPIQTTNSRGINIAPDKRATRTGWGHVSAASPTLVGRYLYFPVMTGTVYVIDTEAVKFSGAALVAINDLGKAGITWTLSSLSSAHGSLYTRTMTEVIRLSLK